MEKQTQKTNGARKTATIILAVLALLLFAEFAAKQGVYHYYLYRSYSLMKDYYKVEGNFWNFKERFEKSQHGRLQQKDPFINDIYNRRYYRPESAGNKYGLSHDEPALKAKEGIKRILCIGSSTVEQGFPSALQKTLDTLEPETYEVINAGIPAASILNTFMDYNLIWKELKPDIVILEHNVDDVAINTTWPFNMNGQDNQFRKHFLQSAQENFARPLGGLRTLFWSIFSDESPWFAERLEQPGKEGLDRFKTLLESFVMAVKGSGAQPVLLTFQPTLSAGDDKGKFSKEFYADIIAFYQLMFYSFTLDGAMQTLDEHNRITRDVAKAMEIPLVETVNKIPRMDMFFIDATHHSDKGNQIVAKLIARKLQENGIIEKQ